MTAHRGLTKTDTMKRPLGVALIGGLLLVQGLFLIASAAAATFLQVASESGDFQVPGAIDITGLTASNVLSAVLVGGLGVFIVLSGIGVLRLHPWAWLAAMALQGWTLAVFLLDYVTSGRSSYSTALLSVVIVFYLNSRTIRRTFDLARRREAVTAGPPLDSRADRATDAELPGGGAEPS